MLAAGVAFVGVALDLAEALDLADPVCQLVLGSWHLASRAVAVGLLPVVVVVAGYFVWVGNQVQIVLVLVEDYFLLLAGTRVQNVLAGDLGLLARVVVAVAEQAAGVRPTDPSLPVSFAEI